MERLPKSLLFITHYFYPVDNPRALRAWEFVNKFLELLEIDSTFFDEAMNELRNYIDLALEKATFIENIEIEEILTRLENLQSLIKRFGSIKESLDYLSKKKEELNKLENLLNQLSEIDNLIKK